MDNLDSSDRVRLFSERINKRYLVQCHIDTGGFGSVYKGTRRSDGLSVAIKKVSRDRGRYKRVPGHDTKMPMEVVVLQKLNEPPECPFIIKILDWMEEEGYFIIVLERPDPCKPLDELISSWQGKVKLRETRVILKQLVLAAKHCEDRGFLHRDIKPENVLVNPETLKIKLIDFGCANSLRREPFSWSVGTPDYYPPEYFKGEMYLGRPTTVWTLGMILFQMLCGSLPFSSQKELLTHTPKLKEQVPAAARTLVLKCLKKIPKNRPTLETILGYSWVAAAKVPNERDV